MLVMVADQNIIIGLAFVNNQLFTISNSRILKIDLTNGEKVNIVAQVVPTILPALRTAQYQEAVNSVLSICRSI